MKMKTDTVGLSQLKANAANPRQIKDEKFTKLVSSVLAFPKMLDIRPIVVDDTFTVLGGNMRYRALAAVAEMKPDEVAARLSKIKDFGKKTAAEQEALAAHWQQWLSTPTVAVIKASELSERERREFIIKDNVSFGEWDYDALANEWDSVELNEWGVDGGKDSGNIDIDKFFKQDTGAKKKADDITCPHCGRTFNK